MVGRAAAAGLDHVGRVLIFEVAAHGKALSCARGFRIVIPRYYHPYVIAFMLQLANNWAKSRQRRMWPAKRRNDTVTTRSRSTASRGEVKMLEHLGYLRMKQVWKQYGLSDPRLAVGYKSTYRLKRKSTHAFVFRELAKICVCLPLLQVSGYGYCQTEHSGGVFAPKVLNSEEFKVRIVIPGGLFVCPTTSSGSSNHGLNLYFTKPPSCNMVGPEMPSPQWSEARRITIFYAYNTVDVLGPDGQSRFPSSDTELLTLWCEGAPLTQFKFRFLNSNALGCSSEAGKSTMVGKLLPKPEADTDDAIGGIILVSLHSNRENLGADWSTYIELLQSASGILPDR